MTSKRPEDRDLASSDLEALLREQSLLPVPLALIGRILDDVLPRAEPVKPWVLVGRAAAAVVVFCASWLAVSGDVPAFADIAAESHVAAALPTQLPVARPTATVLHAATAAGPAAESPVLLFGLGALLLLAGVMLAVRSHRRAARMHERAARVGGAA